MTAQALPPLPEPFHVCPMSRERGRFCWFTRSGEEVSLATTRDVITFVAARYPRAIFMLTTMRTIVPGWSAHDVVAMAVFDPTVVLRDGPRDIREMHGEKIPDGGGQICIHGFVIGGLVDIEPSDIPKGHGVEDGCIPFDLGLFDYIMVNLPHRRN